MNSIMRVPVILFAAAALACADPVAPVTDREYTAVATGESHTCGLAVDGTAYCWGAGRSGQLGNGQLGDSPRPALVIGGHVFRSLSLGLNHTCGVAADGITRCWGSNAQGQVGSLSPRSSAIPLPVVVRLFMTLNR